MRKLILAALATFLLGAAALATPAEAACWRIPGGWRCVHHRVAIVHHRWWHHPVYWHHRY